MLAFSSEEKLDPLTRRRDDHEREPHAVQGWDRRLDGDAAGDAGIHEPFQVAAPGLLDADDPEAERVVREFGEAIADLPVATRRDDDMLTDAARTALRRAVGKRLKKRPQVDVHLLRV